MVNNFFSKLTTFFLSISAVSSKILHWVMTCLQLLSDEFSILFTWRHIVFITYLYTLIVFSSIHTITDLAFWVLLAFSIEVLTLFYTNRYFKLLSFLFYFITVFFLLLAFDVLGLNSTFLHTLDSIFFINLTPESLNSKLFTSSVFHDFLLNNYAVSPNNFLMYFYKYYSVQSCGAFDDFTSVIPGFYADRLVAFSPKQLDPNLNVQHIMDPGSNPLFFSLYTLNFFSYEILFFICTLFVLFLGLFFYTAFTVASQSSDNTLDFDVLYRFNETFLLFTLVFIHFSSANDFIASVGTFGYSFVFNNLFVVHSGLYLLKDFLIFLFLFFNFFFRLRVFFLSKQSGTLRVPMELPFLLLSILTFCSLILSANDFNILLVSLEGITFIIAVIIAFDSNKAAASASIKYFTLGVASSGFFSMASALTYGLFLSLDFKSITDFFYFTEIMTSEFLPLFVFTSALITMSFFIKLSVFPGNFWVLDIYNGCNLPLISVLVLLKCLYFILFAKLYFSIYAYCSSFLFPLIVAASLGSMLFSAYGLLTELHLKQFIAYSSTGQFGFLLITLVCYQDSITFLAIFTYLFYYVTVMLIFFFSIVHLSSLGVVDKLTDFYHCQGSSVTTFFLVVALLSLAGLPPFFGFFAKVNILLNLAASGLSSISLLIVFLLNIAMSFGYVRALRLMYFNFSGSKASNPRLLLEEKAESVIYFSELSAAYVNSNFFLKFSYFFYFGIIQMLAFIQIFGFYFFGYMLHYLDPLVFIFFF